MKKLHAPTEQQQIIQEVKLWDEKKIDISDWQDTPDAIPKINQAVNLHLLLPVRMIEILKEFSRRVGCDLNVLIAQWLNDRILLEKECLLAKQQKVHPIAENGFDLGNTKTITEADSLDPPAKMLFKRDV
jgi:hypothetical protein